MAKHAQAALFPVFENNGPLRAHALPARFSIEVCPRGVQMTLPPFNGDGFLPPPYFAASAGKESGLRRHSPAKHEICRTYHAKRRPEVIQFERLFHIKEYKSCKNRHRDDFLDNF